jgi:hypothetical protein
MAAERTLSSRLRRVMHYVTGPLQPSERLLEELRIPGRGMRTESHATRPSSCVANYQRRAPTARARLTPWAASASI